MFVLDTNVVSELMRGVPQPEVLAWVNARTRRDLFLTAITEAEIRTGIAILPAGRRQRDLAHAADRFFEDLFRNRVLPFDASAARVYAAVTAKRRAAGRPISQLDCQIAAVTRCRGATLATRNVSDFEGTGIDVRDPWTEL